MVDPATATMIASASSGNIFGIIIIFLLIIVPFIVKFWNWSKEAVAQGELYKQLSDTVQVQRKELDKLYEERLKDQEQIFRLRIKVEKLEEADRQVEVLKKKLDDKDRIIAERDARIAQLMQELLQMKDRVHNLEMRLRADEAAWCEACQFKKSKEHKDEQD